MDMLTLLVVLGLFGLALFLYPSLVLGLLIRALGAIPGLIADAIGLILAWV